MHHFDVILCSTASREALIGRSMVYKVMKQRPDQPLFLIDLALPRDIEPAVNKLEGVYLYNLDDLSAMANQNLALRRAEIERARALLRRHAWRLWLQLRRRMMMSGAAGSG
jgi:glutamyl-tRNA reductase